MMPKPHIIIADERIATQRRCYEKISWYFNDIAIDVKPFIPKKGLFYCIGFLFNTNAFECK